MNDTLSAAIKEAYASVPVGIIIYHTLEVRQSGVQDSIYLVQGRQDVEASDEGGEVRSFSASSFRFSLPPSDEEGFTSLDVTFDNVNREVSDFVIAALDSATPVQLIYRPYVSDDLTTPAMVPPLTLFLRDVQITATTVTGKATFMDLLNRRFPSEIYTRARFPTLI